MKRFKDVEVKKKVYIEVDADWYHETGEVRTIGAPIDVAQQEQKVPRGGFEIAYMAALLDLFDKLGGQKYQVLKYLLKHKDGMNVITTTQRDIAKAVGCSTQTVNLAIKVLTTAGALVQCGGGGLYMFNPHIVVKGNYEKEGYIMRKFTEQSEINNVHSDYDDELPGQQTINDIAQEYGLLEDTQNE